MPTNHTPHRRRSARRPMLSRTLKSVVSFWRRGNFVQKGLIVMGVLLILWVGVMYGIARWYIATHARQPIVYGVTFIPSYARYFELDPQETMRAMIDDLGVRQFRLVSYWDEIEVEPGVYNFDELDWQFKMAEDSGSKISLAIGLRQPRWPECHMPKWAESQPMEQWYPQLKTFMEKVINHYKDSPALQTYQLENEFFLSVFGICPDFSRWRLVDEYNFVKSLDSTHPVIVSRSNNIIGIPVRDPRPDISAVSVYKRVWDKSVTHRYVEYPFPAWFYGTLAGGGKILTGRDMVIHELQAEPWLPPGHNLNDINDLDEQNKSLNPTRLANRIEYARATGMKEIYFWGPEWWYWRKVKANDPTIWDTAKREIAAEAAKQHSDSGSGL